MKSKFPILFLGWYFYNIEDILSLNITSYSIFKDILNENVYCVGEVIFYQEKVKNIKEIEERIKLVYKINSEPSLTVVYEN